MNETENIFVVCYNRSEFHNFLFDKMVVNPLAAKRQNYIYVNGPDSIRGHRNPKGFFYGRWREREDIKHIVEVLRVSSYPSNPVLNRISAELWNT